MLDLGTFDSPIGPLTIASRDAVLLSLFFDDPPDQARARLAWSPPDDQVRDRLDPEIAAALAAYFAGDFGALDAVPVQPAGTPFQRRVWQALRRIPAGRTWSYRELARAIEAPAAIRAVGAANGANPVALVIPCHRVIGSDGQLVGYGGGMHRKRWLLAHEGARAGALFELA